MFIAYSNIIDWVMDDGTVTEDDALGALPEECRAVIRRVLAEGEDYKLSFGYSDEDGLFQADFTPRRHHPQCRNYGAWIVHGTSPTEAIMQAVRRWETGRDAPRNTL